MQAKEALAWKIRRLGGGGRAEAMENALELCTRRAYESEAMYMQRRQAEADEICAVLAYAAL